MPTTDNHWRDLRCPTCGVLGMRMSHDFAGAVEVRCRRCSSRYTATTDGINQPTNLTVHNRVSRPVT